MREFSAAESLKNFLRGMETYDGCPLPYQEPASKTSLEGWKPPPRSRAGGPGGFLKNFLRGMETERQKAPPPLRQNLKNFLRGMETRPPVPLVIGFAASKTSLEGWKRADQDAQDETITPQKLP